MNQNIISIETYYEVFCKYEQDGIIDMDKRLKLTSAYQIYRLEEVLSKINFYIPPNIQDQHYIALIKKGHGQKTVGLHNFPLQSNLLLVVPKRVMHSSRYVDLDPEGYVLFFSDHFFVSSAFPKKHLNERRILSSPSARPWLLLNDEQVSQLECIFETILREHQVNNDDKKKMMALKILELLILCDRYFNLPIPLDPKHREGDLVEQLHQLIETNFDQNRDVKFYADMLHLHPNYLNVRAKKHCHSSIKQLIDKRIEIEIKYLLKHTNFSIKQIAARLGFEDPNYFSSFFKKQTSLTPMCFRESS